MPPDRRISSGRADLRRRLLPTVAIALLIAGCGGSGSHRVHSRTDAGHHGAKRDRGFSSGQPPVPALGDPVTLRATLSGAVRRRLPRSFLGLSMEYWDVPAFDSDPAALRRVLSLLKVPGDGPLLLRVGGDSADQAYWGRHASARLGPWPYRITPGWLHTLASIVRRAHIHLMLDLNLAAGSSEMAARFARAALRALPHGSVSGFEIGNEPDIDHRWVDYRASGRAGLFPYRRWWDQFSPARYAEAFAAYARALRGVAPAVALAGPAITNPFRGMAWERRLLSTDRRWVAMITIHRYPLTACPPATAPDFATIARVLNSRIASGLQANVAPALALARRAKVPVRMTELNSVTCEGRRGVSNAFAPALWAPDALFSLWHAGLSGINIHVREGATNAAFSMSSRGVRPHPLLYGLALFARAVGHRGELARLRVGRWNPSVRLWAVRSGRRLNLVVLDKGPHPAHLALRVPSSRPGLIQRLAAPSPRSMTGVTLAGQTLAASGRWIGHRTVAHAAKGAGGRYHLWVPAYSGALISFRL